MQQYYPPNSQDYIKNIYTLWGKKRVPKKSTVFNQNNRYMRMCSSLKYNCNSWVINRFITRVWMNLIQFKQCHKLSLINAWISPNQGTNEELSFTSWTCKEFVCTQEECIAKWLTSAGVQYKQPPLQKIGGLNVQEIAMNTLINNNCQSREPSTDKFL